MGLRIRTNMASINSQRMLELTERELHSSMSKMASGYRINKAADDAAGLAISETMRATTRSLVQAKRNAMDGVSLIQVAEGSMQQISDILIRLRELAVQSSTDTIGNSERSYVNMEYQQLVNEIDRIANSTEFGGIRLLSGEDDSVAGDVMEFHIGPGDASIKNTDVIDIDLKYIEIHAEETLGLQQGNEIGPSDHQDTDFERTDAAEKLTILDSALVKLNDMRALLGSKQNRLTTTVDNLDIMYENITAAKSRIKDVDFAAESATLAKQKILAQAGVSVLSQANSNPEIVMQLLRV